MSTSGLPANSYIISTWPQQADLPTEDYHALMESLLKGVRPSAESKISISQLIKVRLWLADILRKQGEYDQAIEHYGNLLKLIYDEATGVLSETEIWCISKAFIGYVDCGRFSPSLPLLEQPQQTATNSTPIHTSIRLAHLLGTAEKGMAWLEKHSRRAWTASLQLEHALLLKSQSRLEDALHEMKMAYQERESCMEAPGYSLSTHKLELAELLCTIADGEKDNKLVEAANQISAIPLASDSTLKERMSACLLLAKIRQKQGEASTANVELGKAQKFAYEMEQATVAERSHQMLDNTYQDAKKLAEVLAEMDQRLQTVKDKAESLESISVHPATYLPADGSQVVTSPRHISCYVSLPHGRKDDPFYQQVLQPALRKILECEPYYWQVGYYGDEPGYYRRHKCSDCPVSSATGKGGRDCWLKCAQMYIAAIEDWSPDVFADLGSIYAMRMMRKETSLIILEPAYAQPEQQENFTMIKQSLAYHLRDFGEVVPIPEDLKIFSGLPVEEGIKHSLGKVQKYLAKKFFDLHLYELNKKPREHYLSSLWIEEQCRYDDKEMTQAISKRYISMEAFRDAVKKPTDRATTMEASRIAKELSSLSSSKITPGVIESILKAVCTVLEGDYT